MRRWVFAIGVAAALLASALAIPGLAAGGSTWQIDPAHSNAQFVVRHMAISNVQGDFTKISGTVEYDEKDVAQSRVNATIDVRSIDTRVPDRDKDLKSARVVRCGQISDDHVSFQESLEGWRRLEGARRSDDSRGDERGYPGCQWTIGGDQGSLGQ